MNRKLKMGMVGGGRGAFIGAVHRMAANLDGQIELAAGCFSSDPEKNRLSGADLFLDPRRVYAGYEEMAAREAALPAEARMDFVSIVTPNHLHAPIATAFLRKGFHVVCDKPMTTTLAEALALRGEARKSGAIFALTHNYTGYPMVKEARDRVRAGDLGPVLKVVVEYPQGWMLKYADDTALRRASWKADPARAGASGCMADIGTHAENLQRYITGLEIESVCAHFSTFTPEIALEDDGNLLVRFKGGAVGLLYASQISAGEENNLNIRIYGRRGSLAWRQEHPNELAFQPRGEPVRILRRGNDYAGASARRFTRIPQGHPEGFIEAFANLYTEIAAHVRDRLAGRAGGPYDYPTMDDGVIGMAFVETALASAASASKWTPFAEVSG